MENRIVEIVEDTISNRNIICDYESYLKKVNVNAFKKEMYVSYYLFDTTFKDHVLKTNSVL